MIAAVSKSFSAKDFPIKLTHLGEAIVRKLIERDPGLFFKLCGLQNSEVHGGQVFQEVKLRPHEGRRFDGESKVDLVVPIREKEALPIEVKLGRTRLSKARIDEWLSHPRASHSGKRWMGNMMSILDKLIPSDRDDRLVARAENNIDYSLTHAWCVVVRRRIKNAWNGKHGPEFSRANVIAFEDLVPPDRSEEFDAMIRELLLGVPSYYSAWM